MTLGSDNPFPSVLLVEQASAPTASAGDQRLFIDDSTHHVSLVNASGTVVDLQSGNTSMTPAEAANGVTTTFTVDPYLSGTAVAFINGLVQRKGTDWAEVSPAAGTISFTTAPWTGASITVIAMVTA